MPREEDDGTGQARERAKQLEMGSSKWESPMPPQVRTSRDTENVSPRSQGEIPLTDKHTEDIRRRIEEAKERARASPTVDMSTRSTDAARASDTAAPPPRSASSTTLNSVSPELLTELRKIVREEFEQLHKGDAKSSREESEERPSRPAAPRERPSSPIRPFVTTIGATVLPSPVKEAEDKKVSATTSTPSPTTAQQKDSPRQSTVRFSDETKPAAPIQSQPRTDETTRRGYTAPEVELTAIDKKWGVLFEKDGMHTKRMEHVVRGLANYIIEEFMPQKSIVVTPDKMAAFYSHHRLEKEAIPLAVLFRSKSKDFNDALASLYEDLGCQYFLVQAEDRTRPTVPGLTPQGFMNWLVTMIQAFPDEEAKRLDKVVSALPIEADSLLDGKPERLPKQISRYLLPKEAVRKAKRLVEDAIQDFKEDLESPTQGKRGKGSGSSGKPAPIIVTASSDKRSSGSASGGQSSRYVPEALAKENRGDAESSGVGASSYDRRQSTASSNARDSREEDRNRRSSVSQPSASSKMSRTGSIDNNSRGGPSKREVYGSSSTGGQGRNAVPLAPSSSSSRKNRSPPRSTYSQSSTSIDRDEQSSDRYRGSANISAAAESVAANVLGSTTNAQQASSSSNINAAPEHTMRDSRSTSYFGPYREKRASMDDSAPRAPASAVNLREKTDMESSSSSSRSSKRRSMVLPDVKGPTWDDYLRSSAPKSATASFAKREGGLHSSS